jgi:hypothetical protein
MKKSILLAVIFSCALKTYAYDFKVANEDGCEIAYNINSDGTTISVTYTDKGTKRRLSNYADFLCDTMRIPEHVIYDNRQYTVTGLDSMCFRYINQNIHTLELPATIDSIVFYEEVGIDHYADASAFYGNSFRSIIMAENNPKYTTEAGILYTKDKSVLLAYPAGNLRDSVYIKEGVVMLGHGALVWARNIRYLELPLSLKELGEESLSEVDSLVHLIIKDSVERIGDWALACRRITHLTLGSGVKSVGVDFFVPLHRLNVDIYSRAINPPLIYNLKSNTPFLSNCHVDRTNIYVPAQSLNAYRQADGWNRFTNILPIEPPIVTGLDNVQVSWVQNFSATGYVWILYTDEAHTQRYMTLTFDANGHLVNIDLAGSNAPARMPALYEEESEEPTHFAEYYTFTITGLPPNTSYYFVRQSLNGTDVIDEDSGTFATQSSTTALDNINGANTPTKVINNGCILIKQGDKTYTITGAEIR